MPHELPHTPLSHGWAYDQLLGHWQCTSCGHLVLESPIAMHGCDGHGVPFCAGADTYDLLAGTVLNLGPQKQTLDPVTTIDYESGRTWR